MDLASFALSLALLLPLLAVGLPRDLAGVLLVLFVAARLAPTARELAAGRVSDARIAFGTALVLYAAVAVWDAAEMPAQGDQPHYVLAAASLASGDLDARRAYDDLARYRALTDQRLTDEGVGQHVVDTPVGPRLIQGYGLPLLVLPGWVALGRVGAALAVAVAAAGASAVTFLILRDLFGASPPARAAWLAATALVPALPAAVVVYPNAPAALLLGLAFRSLFTAPTRAPVQAGVAAGLTLALTPRDGVSAALLLVSAALLARALVPRAVAAFAIAGALVALLDLVLYGLPLPYAGYLLGVPSVSALQGEPLLAFAPWPALPGILLDRDRGLLGFAPWLVAGVVGIAPLARRRRDAAVAALVVVLGTLAALSLFREWQGGWAPPGRYEADVLPLWVPFVAAGFAAARGIARPLAAGLVAWSAVVALLFAAIPAMAYDARFAEWTTRFLPADPLFWLPAIRG